MDNGGDILQLCRLCLVKDDVNIPIFAEQGDIRQIFLKISSCLPVKVSREDKLPKKICDGCSYKLDMLYEFWNTTANAEKQLLSWLGEAGINAKLADGTISAVAQQIKPVETFVKQEAIDPSDIHTEDDDDKSYMFQQKFSVGEAGPSATVTSNDEPPPKRARRTAAVKAQIAMDPESDDDDDSGEPLTKVEDESEDSDGEDHEPPFVDVPSTSADDQPGPSGVGKDGAEAPWLPLEDEEKYKDLLQTHNIRTCRVVFNDVTYHSNIFDEEHYRHWQSQLEHEAFIKREFIILDDKSNSASDSSSELTSILVDENWQPNEFDPLCSEKLECQSCTTFFSNITDVKSHTLKDSSVLHTFRCKLCNSTFHSEKYFLTHINKHLPVQNFGQNCKQCGVLLRKRGFSYLLSQKQSGKVRSSARIAKKMEENNRKSPRTRNSCLDLIKEKLEGPKASHKDNTINTRTKPQPNGREKPTTGTQDPNTKTQFMEQLSLCSKTTTAAPDSDPTHSNPLLTSLLDSQQITNDQDDSKVTRSNSPITLSTLLDDSCKNLSSPNVSFQKLTLQETIERTIDNCLGPMIVQDDDVEVVPCSSKDYLPKSVSNSRSAVDFCSPIISDVISLSSDSDDSLI